MESLLVLFCDVDGFCNEFLPRWNRQLLSIGQKHRQHSRSLTTSEIMTNLFTFHQSHYRDFKAYYNEQVLQHWQAVFPGLVSYARFVEYIPSVLVPLYGHLVHRLHISGCLSQSTQHTHKVFAGLVTSTGWFFGFKLHLMVNSQGEILQFCITPGNVDDRKPVPRLFKKLFGKLFGDKGYISQPLEPALHELFNLQLITKLRNNIKNQLMTMTDHILLRRRAIIETIIDQLKNISQIEHSRHPVSPISLLISCAALSLTAPVR